MKKVVITSKEKTHLHNTSLTGICERVNPLLVFFLFIALCAPINAWAQPHLVVEPDTLFYSNQGSSENEVLVQNNGSNLLRIDSLRFSTFTSDGWGVRLIFPDTTVDMFYAFGKLESSAEFPDIEVASEDTIRIELGYAGCQICGRASSKQTALAVRDSLFIFSNDEDNNPRIIPIDFAFFVGVEDPINPSLLTLDIYPNPLLRDATLEISTRAPGSYTLRVFDLLGRRVYERSLFISSSLGQRLPWPETLDKLPGGVYLVEITNGTVRITKPITMVR